MRIVCISDTHSLHSQVTLPDGDVLVHAGDFMSYGTKSEELISFSEWFKAQPHKYKVVIAGNHDFMLEQAPETAEIFGKLNMHYLEDSGVIIERVHFWGSPVQPWFHDWAFNRQRGFAINQHWRMIPQNTDVLITHGPPDGILDECPDGSRVGCEDLRERVRDVQPKLHVFGHIHHSYGIRKIKGQTFVNASICNEKYKAVNAPIVVDL